MDYMEVLLRRAADAASAAALASLAWEERGDSDAVSDTAWEADEAILEAVQAVAGIDPALTLGGYSKTRLGRLVMAARLLVLAGTDEEGTSRDLQLAAELLETAVADQ
jgi:hypothetical protein